jgi:hypothetical protein
MSIRTFLIDLFTFAVIALAACFAWAAVASAQPSDLCGRETKTATGYVRVQCIDYPMLRKTTGATMFPNEKGQQVWVRSSDPTIRAYRIAMTFRQDGHLDTKRMNPARAGCWARSRSWRLR